MATPVLMIDTLQKNALDAGFAAAFGGEPTRYFSLPAAQKLAATTPTISVAAFWRLR